MVAAYLLRDRSRNAVIKIYSTNEIPLKFIKVLLTNLKKYIDRNTRVE